MHILPSPSGGTTADQLHRYRLRAALHMWRTRGQPLPLWRLREERTGAEPGEEAEGALMAWAAYEQARLDALLAYVPIGPAERCTITLAEGYELDAAGRALLLLALHMHENAGLLAWLDQGPEWGYARTVSLLAATIGHAYLDVMFVLQVAGSLYQAGDDERPGSVVRLAPHVARSLREHQCAAFALVPESP